MEELQSALNAHMDQMADLVEKLTAELRSGLKPAYENFMGFFHAIDWKVIFTCLQYAFWHASELFLFFLFWVLPSWVLIEVCCFLS